MLKQLAARKSVAAIAREIESGPRLNRVLSARTLTSIGLGSMIGSGIFVLTGTVAYLQRIALPPDAVIDVQLQDVSLQDAPATVITSERYIAEGRQVPFPYELTYDPAAIDPKHTYAVAATNFDCTCQVDGDMRVGLNVSGDQLEYSVSDGVPDIYQKIGENTFKRTFMGYYILSSGCGSQATETVVEEERHTIIILNDQGYIMEHYQGAEASACCFHTFTLGTAP